MPTTAYSRPEVTSVRDATNSWVMNAPVSGGTQLFIRGRNFGPPGRVLLDAVRYGSYAGLTGSTFGASYLYICSNAVVVSDDLIQCTTVAGLGQFLRFEVVVAGQRSTISWNYISY